jgi:hypothetical protein
MSGDAGRRPTQQRRHESEVAYKEIVTSGPRKLADLMQALLAFLGPNDMMAIRRCVGCLQERAMWGVYKLA